MSENIILFEMNRSENDKKFGTVIFQSRWRRGFTAVQIVIGLAVTIAFSYVLLDEESWFLKFLVAAIVLLGLFAVVHGIRNLIRPLTLFAVAERGVLMYMEGGVHLAPPFFVTVGARRRASKSKRTSRDGKSPGLSH